MSQLLPFSKKWKKKKIFVYQNNPVPSIFVMFMFPSYDKYYIS